MCFSDLPLYMYLYGYVMNKKLTVLNQYDLKIKKDHYFVTSVARTMMGR